MTDNSTRTIFSLEFQTTSVILGNSCPVLWECPSPRKYGSGWVLLSRGSHISAHEGSSWVTVPLWLVPPAPVTRGLRVSRESRPFGYEWSWPGSPVPTGRGLRSKITGPPDTSVLCSEGVAVLLGWWDKASRVRLVHCTVCWAKRLGQTQHDSPMTVDVRPTGHPGDHDRRPHRFQGLNLWAQLVLEASWAFLGAARQTTHLLYVVAMVSSVWGERGACGLPLGWWTRVVLR